MVWSQFKILNSPYHVEDFNAESQSKGLGSHTSLHSGKDKMHSDGLGRKFHRLCTEVGWILGPNKR